MKQFFRSIVAGLLAILARAIIRKYRPKIVMVTGSVGKTSTKDAIATVLAKKYVVRASEKSYNSEFGVPLTIIGAGNPWFSLSAWVRVFEEALVLIFFTSDYPELLVLEVGADRPNDLKHILKIATPDAVVVTRLPDIPVHVEAYASADAVRDEEFLPAYALSQDAPLIVCVDDEHARKRATRVNAHVSTFGYAEDADLRIDSVTVAVKEGALEGMKASVCYKEVCYEIFVHGAVGKSQIFAPSAALMLGIAFGIAPQDALDVVNTYTPPSGRGKLLKGIQHSMLIDDTYNASPAAVAEILSSFPMIPAKRKVAVLGDMLELGRYSVEEHEKIGALASKHADVVVSVGVRARALSESARTHGAQEVHTFGDSKEAAQALPSLIQEGDLILIKGSQSIRMERITEALLLNKEDRARLVRQEKEWLAVK